MTLQRNNCVSAERLKFISAQLADGDFRELSGSLSNGLGLEEDDEHLVSRLVPDACREMLRIGVIGLGCTGLSLALEFARRHATVGFDIDVERIDELRRGHHHWDGIMARQLRSGRLVCSADVASLIGCDVLVVAVATPVDAQSQPDLTALREASVIAGRALGPGALVVFESTANPGATEAVCLPLLEQHSGLSLHRDFDLGYSAERINTSDAPRRVVDSVRVTSGSSPAALARVDRLYSSISSSGTYHAPSIHVAAAAELLGNTQRDVNTALVNELATMFREMGIDAGEVLAAAGKKWSPLPFTSGLAGWHAANAEPHHLA